MMKAKFQGQSIIFPQEFFVPEGEYVVMAGCNRGSLNIYTLPRFEMLVEEFRQMREQTSSQIFTAMARVVFSASEVISVKNGAVELPSRLCADLTGNELDILDEGDYIRLTVSNAPQGDRDDFFRKARKIYEKIGEKES